MDRKTLINLLMTLVVLAVLPLGVNLVRQQQILRSRAVEDPIKFTGPNVEQRQSKWVATKPQIALELSSPLGPPGGSGSGGGGGGGSAGECTVEWQLSNSSPAPDSTIQVKVKGIKDPQGWQNVELYLDGETKDFGWGGIEGGSTFVYNKIPSKSLGEHTLKFTTDKGKRACTPEKKFNTVVTTSLPASPDERASRGGPNLMSLVPKGLVREVRAATQGQCDVDSDCPSGNLYCEGPATWICEGVCVDHGCGLDNCHFVSGDPAGCAPPPPPPTCEQQLVRDVCVDCNKSQPLYYNTCTQSYLTSSIHNNPTDCSGSEWCGGGSPPIGGGHNIPPIRGVPCAEGYPIQCDVGNGQTGIQICKPGIVGSDGTCQFDEYATNCYGLNVTSGEYDQYGQCNTKPTSSSPGTPGPGTGGTPGSSPPPVGRKTCSFNGKTLNPGDYAYKCIENTKCPSDGTAGVGVPSVCNADGTTTVTNSNGECTFDCKPGSGTVTPPPGVKTSPPPSGVPKISPPPGGGSPPPSGGGTVTTVSYKIAESPDELSSSPEIPYPSEPVVVNFEFKDKTPGKKFVWAEFKASSGKTSRHSSEITLLGPNPGIIACKVSVEGQNVVFEITGANFGSDRGTVNSGSSTLQIQDWKNDKIKVSGGSTQTGQATPITLTNADGQKAEGNCSALSQLSLGAKTFCRAPSKHDQDNVEIALIDEDNKKGKEKVRIDKDGTVQNLQTKLVEGKKYKVSLKAPKSLRRQAEFTASSGTTNLPNFILPVGDIFPQDTGDGKINALDKAELNRQWVIAQPASGRSGDFNQDNAINSFDWACMRYDFGQESVVEPTDPPQKDDPKFCAAVITPAKNKQTGECKAFPTACIPEGWEKVASCPKP